MKITMAVGYEDGTRQVVSCTAVDLVRFEEKFQKSLSSIGSDPYFGQLAWLAWHACHRQRLTTLGFDEWLGTVVEVDHENPAGDPIVPLDPSPSTG